MGSLSPHDPRTLHEATIEQIVVHTSDTRSFFLRLPAGRRFPFTPGQFLSLVLPVGGKTLTRPYSIASSPENEGSVEICLNVVPGGPGSHYLFSRHVGESVRFTGPWGAFVLEQPPEAECVFVADGTGIAAIRPMIRRGLERESRYPVRLLYGARSEGDLLYREEWEAWARHYPHVACEPILRRPPVGWSGLRGCVFEHVARLYVRQDDDRTRHFYICGVGQAVLQLRDLLRQAGYERRAVHYEKW